LLGLFVLCFALAIPACAAQLSGCFENSVLSVEWQLPKAGLESIRVEGTPAGEAKGQLLAELWGWQHRAKVQVPFKAGNRFVLRAEGVAFDGARHELYEGEYFVLPRTGILVSIRSQRLWYFADGKVKACFKCSTGRRGYPSYKGFFTIYAKTRRSYSRLYEVWMNYNLWVHRGMAIHASNVTRYLGRPASHGCIRLHPKNARWLYPQVAVGTPCYVMPASFDASFMADLPKAADFRED